MSDPDLQLLQGEVSDSLKVLDRLSAYLISFVEERLPAIGRNTDSALIVAGTLENYYTAAETLFVRISQHFENHLSRDRRHSDLLHKMTIQVSGVRPRVLSDRTVSLLTELVRFRHFKRYYFSLDYDWRKLDLLIDNCREAHASLGSDLSAFLATISI